MMAEAMNEASGTNNTSTIVSTKRLMTDKDDDDDGIGADSEKNDRFEYKRSKVMTSQSPNLDEFLLELLQQNNDDSAGKIPSAKSTAVEASAEGGVLTVSFFAQPVETRAIAVSRIKLVIPL